MKFLDEWHTSKKVLGKTTFFLDIKEFDKDNIPEPIAKNIRAKNVSNPDFGSEKIKTFRVYVRGYVGGKERLMLTIK